MQDQEAPITRAEMTYYINTNFDTLQHRIERLAQLVVTVASACGNADLHMYVVTEVMMILRSMPEPDNELF